MKLHTHYVFSAGLLSLIGVITGHSFFASAFVGGVISVFGNSLIDGIGHEVVNTRHGEIIRRTPLTHTVPRSVFWGLVATAPLVAIAYFLVSHSLFPSVLELLLVDGAIVGLSHLALDVFTEKGIYVKRDGRWVRFALAHFRYNDPFANGVAMLVGAVMLYVASNYPIYIK